MIERKASRRSFLGYAATAVVVGVIAGVGGYYAGLLGGPETTVTTTRPTTVTTTRPTTVTTTRPTTVTTTRTTTVGAGQTVTTTVTPPRETTTVTQPPVTKTMTTTVAPPIDMGKLMDEARKEGELMIYGSQKIYVQEEIIKAFNDKYPFINVGFFRATSGKVAEKFIAEANADAVNNDIIDVSDPSLFMYMKNEGFLQPFEIPGYTERYFQASGDDPEHYWHASRSYAVAIAYNTNLVTEEEAPKSWKELTDPKWTEKVGMIDPRAGGGWYLLFAFQSEVLGEDWLKALAKLKPRIYSSGGSARDGIVGGEVPLGYSATEGIYAWAVERQAPLKGILPAEGTIATEGGQAMTKKAPHPNAAKLWILFGASEEVDYILAMQSGFYIYRKGAPIAEGLIENVSPKITTTDEFFAKANIWNTPWAKIADANYRTSINEQFEQIFLG